MSHHTGGCRSHEACTSARWNDLSEAGRSEVRHVLQRFFSNSREGLLLSLLGDDDISPDELKRLKETIANAPEDFAPESVSEEKEGAQ